jgi:hypothetical protein
MNQIFCSREFFNAVPPIQEAMPKNALEDFTVCLHYSNDWGCTNNWDDIYDDPKVEADASMATHRLKHGIVEDSYNKVCTVVCVCFFFFELIFKLHPPSVISPYVTVASYS